jgi:hypothetical protein
MKKNPQSSEKQKLIIHFENYISGHILEDYKMGFLRLLFGKK